LQDQFTGNCNIKRLFVDDGAGMREKQEAFAGLTLGAAVGLLVGMSNTPVTAIVVSSLVALIATFFGLSSQHAEGVKALRIASFGLACPIAILVALTVRSHGWLTPSIQQQIAGWTTAGYTPAEARSFVAFRELGLVPEGQKTAEPQPPVGIRGTLLSENRENDCDRLAASRFGTDEERLNAMRTAGGNWKVLADSLEGVDAVRRSVVMNAAFQFACQP
jgi:hypothetical protein